jgi:hypothetical protein
MKKKNQKTAALFPKERKNELAIIAVLTAFSFKSWAFGLMSIK